MDSHVAGRCSICILWRLHRAAGNALLPETVGGFVLWTRLQLSVRLTPLPLYLKNEAALSGQPPGLSPNFAKTESFRLLKEDAEARLVLYCTWNAVKGPYELTRSSPRSAFQGLMST